MQSDWIDSHIVKSYDCNRSGGAVKEYQYWIGASMGIVCCAQCEGKVSDVLENCPHCGHPLTSEAQKVISVSNVSVPQPRKKVVIVESPQPSQYQWSPGVAAVLSFLLPGLGQIYKGKIFTGLIWMFVVVIGYFCLFLPGLILHLCCVFEAFSGNPIRR